MRIAFVGASYVSVETAKGLIKKGHDVIIVDTDKAKLDELSDTLDCSFLHGDGSQPLVLNEVNPARTDFLFCLTESDQYNVIGSLIGRSLGVRRVVPSISDPQFDNICTELGLQDAISPSRTISGYLQDMVGGLQRAELSTAIKDEARLFTFVARESDACVAQDLKLPDEARVMCFYRKGSFAHADSETVFHEGDEIVILTHSKNLPELIERWSS